MRTSLLNFLDFWCDLWQRKGPERSLKSVQVTKLRINTESEKCTSYKVEYQH